MGAVDGLLYVDKPAGVSSHDVVGVVRRAARSKRVGHAGTLDPFATGLLVLGVGQCTRLLPYIVGEPKVYEAVIRLGSETDTDDATGTVTRIAPVPAVSDPEGARALDAAMRDLTGTIDQVPPAFSAKHVNGERAYAIARRGEAVTLRAVAVTVHRWELLGVSDTDLRVRITCGGGTYIRALARDLGRLLQSAAHCLALRRVASGPARVQDAVDLSMLTSGSIADGSIMLRSPLDALGDVAREPLDGHGVRDLAQGRSIVATRPGEHVAFVSAATGGNGATAAGPDVLGMGVRLSGNRWQPRVVLLGGNG